MPISGTLKVFWFYSQHRGCNAKIETGLVYIRTERTSMNNGTQASNDEFTLDEEFRTLLPPLTAEDFGKLADSILKDGCRDPLIVWKEERLLVDGYNRHAICVKHGLPFRIELKSFADRDEVMDWMIENQKSRRNMNKFLWAETVLKRKDHIAAVAKRNQRAGVRLESNERVDTLQKLADIAGITRDALYKVKVILAIAAADPTDEGLNEQIDALRKDNADVTISGVYDELLKIKGKKGITQSVRTTAKQRRNIPAPPNPIPTETPQDLAGHIIATLNELEQQYPQIHDRADLYNTVGEWANNKKIELARSQK